MRQILHILITRVSGLRLALPLLLCLLTSPAARAYDFAAVNDDGITIYYYLRYNQAWVDSPGDDGTPYAGDIVIPSQVTGTYSGTTSTYEVVGVRASAFKDCTDLISVTLPEGLTSLGNYAFSGCTSLASVVIPSTVTSLGSSVFEKCSSLENVSLPEGLTSIPSYAFCQCTALSSIDIPSTVTNIGNLAFTDDTSLASVTLPEGLVTMGNSVFNSCTSLTSIVIPSTVTSMGLYAFQR
ncbi:MAG: leucine-rich repeat domain-containing protein [Bacteroidales bacterium]|nr:leucine-rich repeat domain-containing protein [Bacteroidales bacterium]